VGMWEGTASLDFGGSSVDNRAPDGEPNTARIDA
jgi:hypothetical protein